MSSVLIKAFISFAVDYWLVEVMVRASLLYEFRDTIFSQHTHT